MIGSRLAKFCWVHAVDRAKYARNLASRKTDKKPLFKKV